MTEFITALLASTICFILYWGSFKLLKRKHPILASSCLLSAIFCTTLSVIIFSFISEKSTFKRLTQEHHLASIEFQQLGNQHYQAKLIQTGADTIYMNLYGDQWQVDSRIIKWNGVPAWLGLKPMYRLERLSGRYQSVTQETKDRRSAYELNSPDDLASWEALIHYQDFIPWMDAYYGSATYLPMKSRARFDITISASGLVSRPANEEASLALLQWPAS